MQRAYQIAALCFMGLSAGVIWGSGNLEYYSKLGPGAGFFPFWLGVALGMLSLVWFIQVSRRSGRPKDETFLPGLLGTGRIVLILTALVVLVCFMNLLGFQLPMFLFLVFLLIVFGRQRLWVTLIIAFLGSVGVYHMFGSYLDVSLPTASLAILSDLGL